MFIHAIRRRSWPNIEMFNRNIQLGPRGWSGLQAVPDLVDSIGDLASPDELSPTQFRGLNWHKDSYPVSDATFVNRVCMFKIHLVCLHSYA
jgi:hypothetical protein